MWHIKYNAVSTNLKKEHYMHPKQTTKEMLVTPEITTVPAAEQEKAFSTIILSFCNDPMARWSLPDAKGFLTFFPELVRAFAGNAFKDGTAYQIGGFAGVAIWLAPGSKANNEALGAIMEKATPESRKEEAKGIFEQMAQFHLQEPHWYLPLIGVDPAYQGKGYGSAMMQHALRACDADGLPAYLESSNPANIPFYERHGFVLLGKIHKGSSPTLYPMLRKAMVS